MTSNNYGISISNTNNYSLSQKLLPLLLLLEADGALFCLFTITPANLLTITGRTIGCMPTSSFLERRASAGASWLSVFTLSPPPPPHPPPSRTPLSMNTERCFEPTRDNYIIKPTGPHTSSALETAAAGAAATTTSAHHQSHRQLRGKRCAHANKCTLTCAQPAHELTFLSRRRRLRYLGPCSGVASRWAPR